MTAKRKTPAKAKAKRKVPPKGGAAKAATKPSASPAVQKAKAQVAVLQRAKTDLGVKGSASPAPVLNRPLKPIEVELQRRARIDSLYHRLVKPSPKGKG
jgi:hypothetical protein